MCDVNVHVLEYLWSYMCVHQYMYMWKIMLAQTSLTISIKTAMLNYSWNLPTQTWLF